MKRLTSLCCAVLCCAVAILTGCSSMSHHEKKASTRSFASDVAFLGDHGSVTLLSDKAGKAKVAISTELQARVMTSTATGDDGLSFGWINRDYFKEAHAGKMNPHMSPWGGEERFWIGPEGGQFALFFEKGVAFDFDHWFTPKWIDTEPFDLVSKTDTEATYRRDISFANYSGTPFSVRIDRMIKLLDANDVWSKLSIPAAKGVDVVAFESNNTITNTGSADWSKKSGLLSIWILGMLNASPATTVVIPVRPGEGPSANDDYFGKVPADRLKTINDIVYFKADANYRSKIGIAPKRAKPILGSYDAQNHVLTIVQYTFDPKATDYVNSAWKLQDNPFGGDIVNSYNDGPPAPGKPQMGKFYELETSSAARELKKGESLKHTQRTIHFQGDEKTLDSIARQTLGVGLDQIKSAF